MLRNKSTSNIKELKTFFTSSQKACNTVFEIVNKLRFSSSLGLCKEERLAYSTTDIVLLLLLFPLFQISNVNTYRTSTLQSLFKSGKDIFYRLKNNELANWRSLGYSFTIKLLQKSKAKEVDSGTGYRCLIADDTDLPKTGICIELIGRIWSHVTMSSKLGFKGLFLGIHDGKSFYGLDFSLHGEKGKNKKKPYGLNKKQLKGRFSKNRDKHTAGELRRSEYFNKKTDTLNSLVKTAIKKGIQFDYLLVDSWFVNQKLIDFVLRSKVKFHLLGMAKMGNSKYEYNDKDFSAKQLIDKQKRNKKLKRTRKLNLQFSIIDVLYKGQQVRLFFSKTTRNDKWKVLLSTNRDIDFEEAYRIYCIRWSIEVFFKESKQHLNLGKSQSRDFDAQIADTTISMMQYNTLSLAKRFLDYESIGGIFREAGSETLEFTVVEKIWGYILDILSIVSELFEIDFEEMLDKITSGNKEVSKIIKMKAALDAA